MKSDLKEIELSRKNKTVEYACHCSPRRRHQTYCRRLSRLACAAGAVPQI
jgi:hypothetical protein